MYFPLENTCMTATSARRQSLDDLYAFRNTVQMTPGAENVGRIEAISAATGATAWQIEQRAGTLSLLTTGGGLLFGGDVNGRFRAYDQRSGEQLWEVNLGSPVNGYPVSFRSRWQAVRRREHGAFRPRVRMVAGLAASP